ncbi:MAG: type II CRISPR RNA-guided endonuclease Cas9 [Chloroflexota bacterium]|nr:type II CRISPR RNA-guided endonuclease Cas9 [Chloroflexota bacterium]
MQYRLGIDIGTNSIGWAAVRLDEGGDACGVLDMGVRIFPDGRENSRSLDPLGRSLAVNRRIPRGQRRRRDRYLKRRSGLLDALTAYGLMPPDAETRAKLAACDPYPLRKLAIERQLSPYALGRALFHLNQRRGFKSNRKAQPKDDEKESREDLGKLRVALREGEAETLGAFLAEQHAKSKPVRARPGLGLYPDRAMYEKEFDAIKEKQERHHYLRSDQWDSLKDIIFYQRPLKPVNPGWCLLEEGERRAPRSMSSVQEFRILQEVNNLRTRVGIEPERPLNEAERARVLHRLYDGKDIDLQKPLKGLRLEGSFNLSRGGRKRLQGDQTTARLAKPELFGERWMRLSLEQRDAIVQRLLDIEGSEAIQKASVDEWGLSEAQAEKIADVSLPDGHMHLSLKAIRKVLPHLRDGMRYDEAVVEAGYPHHSDFRNAEAHDRLPYYGAVLERNVVCADPRAPDSDEVKRYGRFPNPTVHVGLNQLRRLVNRLVDVYGKPAEIVVEFARDLKSNKEQREDYVRRQRSNEQENDRRRKELLACGVEPKGYVMEKLRLWEEQGPVQARLCPYTGKSISFGMAVSDATEVDHVLPRRTLDDSLANKVLCLREANRFKSNRSPYDAFHDSPPGYDYNAILARAEQLPDNKRWRFLPDAMDRFTDESRFLERQLNETRYLSHTARAYLAHLYDEKNTGRQAVRVIPGGMTARLRRGWELEGMLREGGEGKQRDDHRHHAIDAFVAANTTQGLVQRFQQAAEQRPEERLSKLTPEPWPGFRPGTNVKPFIDRMTVSYKPDHGAPSAGGKTTGQLHQATAYGLLEEPRAGGGPVKVVIRMNLADFQKRTALQAVRDPGLRQALLELWDAVEAEKPELDRAEEELARREDRRPQKLTVGAIFAERAGDETGGVSVNGHMQRVRRVRVVEKQSVIPIRRSSRDPKSTAYKGYVRGDNAFADVWRMPDGSWKVVVVPTFEFNQQAFTVENFRPHPAAKRLMRLHKDDMGAFDNGKDRRIVRVRKISNDTAGPQIYMDAHNEANVDRRIKDPHDPMKARKYSAKQLREQDFRRVRVDEIGRVLDPGPHTA